jgi:hypothetical protein
MACGYACVLYVGGCGEGAWMKELEKVMAGVVGCLVDAACGVCGWVIA